MAGISHRAETFQRFAMGRRREELLGLLRGKPRSLNDTIMVAVCDYFAWAFRIYELRRPSSAKPSRSTTAGLVPMHNNSLHFAWGAEWARNRITHGDAHLLDLELSDELDDSLDSAEIQLDDPEVTMNGRLLHQYTVRFAPVTTLIASDWRQDLQPFYNTCVAEERVIVAADRLASA